MDSKNLQGGITMKIYKVTTITDCGRKFVRTVTAESAAMAIKKLRPKMERNEIPALVEEV